MTAKFIAYEGDLKDLTLELKEEKEWIIGRDPDTCDLILEDPAVSRKHLTCYPTPEGWILENLSATNPILINGKAIEAPYPLKEEDIIKIGGTTFTFREQELAETPTAPKMPPTGKVTTETEEKPASEETNEDPESKTEEEEQEVIFEDTSDSTKENELQFELLSSERWILKVVAGPNVGAEIPLKEGESYTVGTDITACDVIFNDLSVSKKHVKLNLDSEGSLTLEDLGSRNGTFVDGQPFEVPSAIQPNSLVTLGTTTFVIIDREAANETVISSHLPTSLLTTPSSSPVEETEDHADKKQALADKKRDEALKEQLREEERQKELNRQKWIFGGTAILILSGLVILMGLLFWPKEIVPQYEDQRMEITRIVESFPSISFQYTPSTGRLFLRGHVLTANDYNQIFYGLEALEFVDAKDIVNNIIINEFASQQVNQDFSKNSELKGLTMSAPKPGQFIVSGYLKTTEQKQLLNNYLRQNFPLLDLLEKRVIVEEELAAESGKILRNHSVKEVSVELLNGTITLNGFIGFDQEINFDKAVIAIKKLNGVSELKNFVAQLEPEEAMINLTGQYEVTGFSKQDNINLNIIINGRILSRGDLLDGMTVTSIRPQAVFLERDGFKYRINYNQ